MHQLLLLCNHTQQFKQILLIYYYLHDAQYDFINYTLSTSFVIGIFSFYVTNIFFHFVVAYTLIEIYY